MAKKRYIAFTAAALLAISVIPCLAQKVSALDSISAKSAILIEQSSGKVLFEKNADERLLMASTTKIMTALVALENADPEAIVEIPTEAVGVEGSSVYLKAGEKLRLSELLYALMLESANDAAVAIAVSVSGSVDSFVEAMNATAARLKLYDTHFENPHGLDSREHYTSARDLARLAAYALELPSFRQLVSSESFTVESGDHTRYLHNHNRLLREYDGAIGVKTGFTKASGRCLVSAATRDNMTLIAVTISAPNDWQEHRSLLDYGFERYELVKLAEKGEELFELPVACGSVESVKVAAADKLCVCLDRDHANIEKRIYLPHFAIAPVFEGEIAGYAEYSMGGEIIASVALEYSSEVPSLPKKRDFFEKLFNNQ